MKVDKNDINELLLSKDSKDMRAFLNNCLLWNADDITTIKECVKEFSKIEGVFDTHDNGEINKNKESYNKEYLIDLNTDLTFNFSKERYLHALDVANYLEVENIVDKTNRQANISDIKVGEIEKKKRNSIQVRKKKSSSLILPIAIITIILVAVIVMLVMK